MESIATALLSLKTWIICVFFLFFSAWLEAYQFYWSWQRTSFFLFDHLCACVHTKSHQSCPTLLQPCALWPVRRFCPWDAPGKNIGVGYHILLQEIFPTQGLNLGLLHYRWILYYWATGEAQRNQLWWLILCVNLPSHRLPELNIISGVCLRVVPGWEQYFN